MTNTQLSSRACRGTPIPNPLDDVAQGLQALETHLATIQAQITDLEKAGIINATPHWRKDKHGQPRILYLIHPSENNHRKRQYVGVKPDKQAEALARIQRWEQHQQLEREKNRLATRLTQIHRDVHAIQIAITELGEQCRTRELARYFQQEQDQ